MHNNLHSKWQQLYVRIFEVFLIQALKCPNSWRYLLENNLQIKENPAMIFCRHPQVLSKLGPLLDPYIRGVPDCCVHECCLRVVVNQYIEPRSDKCIDYPNISLVCAATVRHFAVALAGRNEIRRNNGSHCGTFLSTIVVWRGHRSLHKSNPPINRT